jgi:hypothetical protein
MRFWTSCSKTRIATRAGPDPVEVEMVIDTGTGYVPAAPHKAIDLTRRYLVIPTGASEPIEVEGCFLHLTRNHAQDAMDTGRVMFRAEIRSKP